MRDGTLNMAMNGIEDGEKVNPDGKSGRWVENSTQ